MTRKKAFQLMWQLSGFETGCFALVQPNHDSFWKWEPPKPEPSFHPWINSREFLNLWTITGGEAAVGALAFVCRSGVKSSLFSSDHARSKHSLFLNPFIFCFSSHLSGFMHVANDN